MTKAEELAINLKAISGHFQYWLDWQEKDRKREGLEVADDNVLRLEMPVDGVTPPVWPTRRSMKHIIAVIEEAQQFAEDAHNADLEVKFYDA